jgi:hypothetical protein
MIDDPAIVKLEEHLQRQIAETAAIKRVLNSLYKAAGQDEPYPDIDEDTGARGLSIRSDEFHGRALATVVEEYMRKRRAANTSPPTVREIYDALMEGGYEFETDNVENAKRSLRISLSKNPKFYRLPQGQYGLREWYPKARRQRVGGEESEEANEEENGG